MPAHAYNKLKAKKIGPLTVLERINDNVYRLQLPANITPSDGFNVRYLSRFVSPDPVPDSRSNRSNPEGPDATLRYLHRQGTIFICRLFLGFLFFC